MVDPVDNISYVLESFNEILFKLKFLSFFIINDSALAKTVKVLRPKKSNLTRPAFSTNFILNCVAGISSSLNL